MLNHRAATIALPATRPQHRALAWLGCLALAGCAWHWPWMHRAAPAPRPVHEISIEAPSGAQSQAAAMIAQYWDRNTLLLDLTALAGEGEVTLAPSPVHGWPIRLEFRVQPGAIARLEVQASARVVFEVPAQGAPLVFKLAPDAYGPHSAHITVRWSAADGSAH
jgi:hypothetical protein